MSNDSGGKLMSCECTITEDLKMPGRICKLHFKHMEAVVLAERKVIEQLRGDLDYWKSLATASGVISTNTTKR